MWVHQTKDLDYSGTAVNVLDSHVQQQQQYTAVYIQSIWCHDVQNCSLCNNNSGCETTHIIRIVVCRRTMLRCWVCTASTDKYRACVRAKHTASTAQAAQQQQHSAAAQTSWGSNYLMNKKCLTTMGLLSAGITKQHVCLNKWNRGCGPLLLFPTNHSSLKKKNGTASGSAHPHPSYHHLRSR